MQALKAILATAAAATAICVDAIAGSPISGAKDGVAIQGYDAVAYFEQKAATKGLPEHTHVWTGTVWRFATEQNKDAFAAAPEKYAPQFGGHCALSVANGQSSSGAGEAWTVVDDKLYLNGSIQVRERWRQNTSQNIFWGNKEWPKIRDRLLAQ